MCICVLCVCVCCVYVCAVYVCGVYICAVCVLCVLCIYMCVLCVCMCVLCAVYICMFTVCMCVLCVLCIHICALCTVDVYVLCMCMLCAVYVYVCDCVFIHQRWRSFQCTAVASHRPYTLFSGNILPSLHPSRVPDPGTTLHTCSQHGGSQLRCHISPVSHPSICFGLYAQPLYWQRTTVSTKVLRQEHGEGETMKLRPEGKARG